MNTPTVRSGKFILIKKYMPKHGDKPEFEYNLIIDGIYIGTNLCCQVHFDEGLLAKGVKADISLEAERIDSPFGVEYYLWLPVVDEMPPSLGQFIVGVEALKKLVELKEKVYVHCQNGHGRAPSLVAAYLIAQGNDMDEAVAIIQSKRPTIHINDKQKKNVKGV